MKTGFSQWSNDTLQTFVAGPLSFMWQGRTPVGRRRPPRVSATVGRVASACGAECGPP